MKEKKTIKIELTEKELHCLYDALYICPAGELKINHMLKDWESLFVKIEKIAVPELYEEEVVKS